MKKFEVYAINKNTIRITAADYKENWFSMESMIKDCPHHFSGTAQDCAALFAKWLNNSLELMAENHCTSIEITASHN